MRFLLAVTALTVALCVSGAAQEKTKPYNAKSSGEGKNEPKSTAPPPKASSSAASSKDLQRVENQQVKGGRGGQAKTKNVGIAKTDRSSNQSINFNGHGGSGNTGSRNAGSLKGRLKQKGQGKQH